MTKTKYEMRQAADIKPGDIVRTGSGEHVVLRVGQYIGDKLASPGATLKLTGAGLNTIHFTDGTSMVTRVAWGGAEVRVA